VTSRFSEQQKSKEVNSKSTTNRKKKLISQASTKLFILGNKSESQKKSSRAISSKPNSPRGANSPVVSDSEDTEEIEKVIMDDISPDDAELIDSHLRDSLIKAFMVIFTNEKSQHLLLNKDLIDIAFNCLEFCKETTLEAKRHVARLISIIFKFP
jgi:hypothetical protein